MVCCTILFSILVVDSGYCEVYDWVELDTCHFEAVLVGWMRSNGEVFT